MNFHSPGDIGETIMISGGYNEPARLVFDGGMQGPSRYVRVVVGNTYIYIGCHRITHRAWKRLKELIDHEIE